MITFIVLKKACRHGGWDGGCRINKDGCSESVCPLITEEEINEDARCGKGCGEEPMGCVNCGGNEIMEPYYE